MYLLNIKKASSEMYLDAAWQCPAVFCQSHPLLVQSASPVVICGLTILASADLGMSWKTDRREGRQPLEDVVVPPDLPIEAIAEEVKDAWRLKEVHVESLMKKAVEKSERPWLMFLGASTIVCIIMLALVFWRLESLL